MSPSLRVGLADDHHGQPGGRALRRFQPSQGGPSVVGQRGAPVRHPGQGVGVDGEQRSVPELRRQRDTAAVDHGALGSGEGVGALQAPAGQLLAHVDPHPGTGL